MEAHQSTGSFAEEVFRELRKITPTVYLGFPSVVELQGLKAERLECERLRWLCRQEAEDREFQRLKNAALAQLRKDRP